MSNNTVNIYCSFCGKNSEDVEQIIRGPAVFICNECVDLCKEIVEEHKRPNKTVKEFFRYMADRVTKFEKHWLEEVEKDKELVRENIKLTIDEWQEQFSSWREGYEKKGKENVQ